MAIVIPAAMIFIAECIIVGAMGGLLNCVLPLASPSIRKLFKMSSRSMATPDLTNILVHVLCGGVVGWILALMNANVVNPTAELWETILVYGYAGVDLLKALFSQAPTNGGGGGNGGGIPLG